MSTHCKLSWNKFWVGGASKLNLSWLARGADLKSNVYFVLNGEAGDPVDHQLPWHVLLTLSTHSRKHVFCSAALPEAKLINKYTANVHNKLCWRWRHRHSAPLGGWKQNSLRISKDTPPYGDHRVQLPQPEFSWCKELLRTSV